MSTQPMQPVEIQQTEVIQLKSNAIIAHVTAFDTPQPVQ
jgi:hypothetical protein